jgi:two-component system uhpT operon response regulator UhpA
MIQVLILDRHRLSRDALGSLLGACDDISVVESAQELTLRTNASGQTEVDILLIDQDAMEEAVDLIGKLKSGNVGIRTLVLADTAEGSVALSLLGAGVDGYLTKNDDRHTLLTAIRCLASGNRYVCPGVGWQIARDLLKAYPTAAVH